MSIRNNLALLLFRSISKFTMFIRKSSSAEQCFLASRAYIKWLGGRWIRDRKVVGSTAGWNAIRMVIT